ncbi:hypothetical protein [Sphingomonas sp.]|uniref:hypothetical protein n=1 Tax=Sphingomonas sp. TaxID=28214 RepID=UPI0025F96BBE|nr:hypothetical protein [Sphingomonas sp.]
MLLGASPALADDTATKTGLVVGLGLNAAKGQTTLGNGAGGIEAGVTNVQAFTAAAQIIIDASTAGNPYRRPVLLAAHDQQVDLVSPLIVRRRIEQFRAAIAEPRLACSGDIAEQRAEKDKQKQAETKLGILGVPISKGALTPFVPSDFAQALTTDITIAPIALSADDRMLVNAVEIRGGGTFHLVGEGTGLPAAGSRILAGYYGLVDDIAQRRAVCVRSDHASVIAAADSFANSLTAADKGALSALATAIQLEPYAGGIDTTGAATNPPAALLLRVAVEQVGGTAITRSNIFYELGLLRGAATVASGLVVSYRLVDSASGQPVATGIVYCMTPQRNLRDVAKAIGKGLPAPICDKVQSPMPAAATPS